MALAERPAAARQLDGVDDIHMHTILEAAAAAPNSNDDDILEYDEDNVVVIDLTEERNSSSRLRPELDDNDDQPKTGELALMREVRYENYVDAETNETIEVKRQVYYDDSDLISPPDYCQDSFQEESNHELQIQEHSETLLENGRDAPEDPDIVAPPSQFSTSSNFSDTTSEENTQIAQACAESRGGSANPLTDDEIDRLFRQASLTQSELCGEDDDRGAATPENQPEETEEKNHSRDHQPPCTVLNESQLTWLNYQKYCQEEEQENAVKSQMDTCDPLASYLSSSSSEEELGKSTPPPPPSSAAKNGTILPPVVCGSGGSNVSRNTFKPQSLPPLKTPPRLPTLSGTSSFHQFDALEDRRRPASADSLDLEENGVGKATTDGPRRSRGRKKARKKAHLDERGAHCMVFKTTLGQKVKEDVRSASCKRPKSTTSSCRDSPWGNTPGATTSYSVTNTLCRRGGRGRHAAMAGMGPVLKAKSNDFLLDHMDMSYTSTTLTSTLSQSSLVTKMTRIEKNLYLGSLEAATDVILLESHGITHIVSVDSVPLPRKMTSMLPRIALLHLQVTDLPDEDLLSHFTTAIHFIEDCLDKGGACLVHCLRGRSRSATVVAAYLMHRHSYPSEKALKKLRSKRPSVNPHASFRAQLKLYQDMDFNIDPTNIQLKMFRLHCASERMRKAKILFRDSLDIVLDEDPDTAAATAANAMTSSGVFSSLASSAKQSTARHPMAYKCKRCRRTLATAFNLLPHCVGESPDWLDPKWALPSEEVLEGASDTGLALCPSSLFINPVRWMANEIKGKLSGRLYCPHCQAKVGHYSWVLGRACDGSAGCGATVTPAFQLDVTEIIFRTKNKYLQSTGREPIMV